tara:strand:+ start:3030 stop:3716 length:687 start_codon:yes stop_codon:yes gene_type:complete
MFDKFDVEVAMSLANENVPQYIRSLMPDSTDELDKMFWNFAKHEARRFTFGKQTGYTVDDMRKYFIPIAQELEIDWEGMKIPLKGHVDRIDRMKRTNCYCVTEYKTSKQLKIPELRQEVGFYANILNNTDYLDMPVNYWSVYDPRIDQYHLERFSPMTLRAVDNGLNRLFNKIADGGPFPRKVTPLCLWCSFDDECLYGDDEIEMQRLPSELIKKKENKEFSGSKTKV